MERDRQRIRMELWVSEYKRIKNGPTLVGVPDPPSYWANAAVDLFDKRFPPPAQSDHPQEAGRGEPVTRAV